MSVGLWIFKAVFQSCVEVENCSLLHFSVSSRLHCEMRNPVHGFQTLVIKLKAELTTLQYKIHVLFHSRSRSCSVKLSIGLQPQLSWRSECARSPTRWRFLCTSTRPEDCLNPTVSRSLAKWCSRYVHWLNGILDTFTGQIVFQVCSLVKWYSGYVHWSNCVPGMFTG